MPKPACPAPATPPHPHPCRARLAGHGIRRDTESQSRCQRRPCGASRDSGASGSAWRQSVTPGRAGSGAPQNSLCWEPLGKLLVLACWQSIVGCSGACGAGAVSLPWWPGSKVTWHGPGMAGVAVAGQGVLGWWVPGEGGAQASGCLRKGMLRTVGAPTRGCSGQGVPRTGDAPDRGCPGSGVPRTGGAGAFIGGRWPRTPAWAEPIARCTLSRLWL